MRRLAFAASLVLIAAGAAAQPRPATFQLDSGKADVSAGKSKFSSVAGALQWTDGKPEQSTFALSLDTTSLSADDMKAALDAPHFPELRIITTGPGRKSGDKLSLPTQVTIKEVTKPVTFQVSFKTVSRTEVDMHAEGTIRGGDFKLKGGDIPLVIDTPFERTSGAE